MYLHITELLCCTPETNIVNQLHFSEKIKFKTKTKIMANIEERISRC